MKYIRRTLAVLTAAAVLVLTGCSAMLERSFTSVTPHNSAPTAEGDPSVLRADSYQELVNALIYLVNAGAQEGTIRLYLDPDQELVDRLYRRYGQDNRPAREHTEYKEPQTV